MFTSEASSVYEKMYFCAKKLLFEHFFVSYKMKMTSLKQFILCSNLFSKLDKSCFKEAIFILQLAKKNAQKAIFRRKNTFFCKRSSLRSQKFLSVRALLVVYSKLVGTPCMTTECPSHIVHTTQKYLFWF